MDAHRPDESESSDQEKILEKRRLSAFVRPQAPRNLNRERRAEDRSATWLELFFDLCFVVAVAALARGLHSEPDLGGFLPVLRALCGGVAVVDDLYLVRLGL